LRILIISDAAPPQVNGVVRTLSHLERQLTDMGHDVLIITPDGFRTMPAPSYPEIRLALRPGGRLAGLIEGFQPQAIHLATEGPLGWAGRRYCLRHGLPYTTSYTTRFPEYLHARWRIPLRWSYSVLRRFHGAGAGTMVATPSMRAELERWGFTHLRPWTRGVDTGLFRPQPDAVSPWPRPVLLYAGRVAVEKNIEAFLRLDMPGTKVVVGAGPQLETLRQQFPDAKFPGYIVNGKLAAMYAAADVFVFPSRTDTFGLVMLEALASGVPVAAFPTPGPLDVIGDSGAGVLDEDLGRAVRQALTISREHCRAYALTYSWQRCAGLFLEHLAVIDAPTPAADAAEARRLRGASA
jgi:glycosyltransferase involved in cell wall biosynthesis